jgi:hypothetical protein
MPDDLTARYGHFNHRELYAMLMQGSPTQVADLAAIWKSMEATMGGLADSLRADLDKLLHGWDSPAGREFDRRVGLAATYAHLLADEFTAIHTGLSVMAAALDDAQKQAEHPDTHDHHHGHTGHASPLSIIGALTTAFGGVIGPQLGHQADQVEADRARARMVAVVCALAAEYRVTDYGTWPPRVPPPPQDTPARRPELIQSSPVVVQPESQPIPAHTKPHHQMSNPLPAAPAVPGVITAQPAADAWPGTGVAVTGAVLAAGGIAAAAVVSHRSRKGSGAGGLVPAEGLDDGPGSDGVVRSSHGMQGTHNISLHGVVGGDGISMTSDRGGDLIRDDLIRGDPGHGDGPHGGIHAGAEGLVLGSGADVNPAHSGAGAAATVGSLHTGSELASGSETGPTAADAGGAGSDSRNANTPPPGTPGTLGSPGAPGTPGATGSVVGGTSTGVSAGTGAGAGPGSGIGTGTTHATGITGDPTGGPRGVGEERRWMSDGQLTWGDNANDSVSLVEPEPLSTED